MRHLANVELGVATHTGRLRSANEDDFLIYAPQDGAEAEQVGWVFAIADGMGGAAGGAEASRTAVRAVVRPFLDEIETGGAPPSSDRADGGEQSARERMRRGFAAAVQQVFALSVENPNLRGMGTTLTVINLIGDRVVLGHVGDTRCVLFRGDSVDQVSEDHAVREPDNFLTRCIGAGQREVDVDVAGFSALAGDRWVLMTDGLWGVVDPEEVRRVVATLSPQAAAEELVRVANRKGGPDNSTIVIVHLLATGPAAETVEVALPAEEVIQSAVTLAPTRSLMPARWPWWVLILGLAVLAVGVAKAGFGVDLVQAVRRWID